MHTLGRFLDRVTMYRLMMLFLCALLGAAAGLSALKILPYDAVRIILQTIFLVAVCRITNAVIARLVKAQPNEESSIITGLILSAIIGPLALPGKWLVLLVCALAAMAGKYIFALHKSHIFNPAALGMVVSALLLGHPASWWIGSRAMFPVIVLGGLLVMQKIRRFHLGISFLGVYLGLVGLDELLIKGSDFFEAALLLKNILIDSSLLFFVFVMLVEPLTGPQTRGKRIIFGAFIGLVLFLFQKFAPQISFSLELSLLAGNIFARILSPDFRQVFILRRTETATPVIGNFWFEPTRPFSFLPGQFLEYTLAHKKPDSRGVRRYFTIASSPTEKQVLLATKFANPSSTFKQALKNMAGPLARHDALASKAGEEIIASKVAGDFVLPKDETAKLVFAAGGIGITPFRSMIQYLIDTGMSRDIILIYAAKTEEDLVFKDIFAEAQKKSGMKTVYTLSDLERIPQNWSGRRGSLNAALIQEEVPDFKERIFYISGPEPMVWGVSKTLSEMGVAEKQIKRDYFPGYA